MIRWEPGIAKAGPDESPAMSVIDCLMGLGQALADLDATDPDTDSILFDRATDHLITAARHTVTAAHPVLDHPHALQAALREAIDDRRDPAGWCRDSAHAAPGLCGDHADDLAQADVYQALLPVVTYGGRPGSAAG